MQPSPFRFSFSVLALATCLVALPAQAQRVSVLNLPTQPGVDVYAADVNSRGQVVGRLENINEGITTAFVWSEAGGLQQLPLLGGNYGSAMRINDRGQILASSRLTGLERPLPVLREPDGRTLWLFNLDSAVALNASGAVLGLREEAPTLFAAGSIQPVFIPPSGSLRLNALADNGRVAGSALFRDGRIEPFVHDPAFPGDVLLPFGNQRLDYRNHLALSPDGRLLVANAARNPVSATHAYFASHGDPVKDMTPLLTADQSSFAYAVSNLGLVAGSQSEGIRTQAMLWRGERALNLSAAAGITTPAAEAMAINALGQVVVQQSDGTQARASLVTLQPDWAGGNGDWASSAQWDYAGMGPLEQGPGALHDVWIRPAGSATVRGAALAEVRSLVVGGAVGEIVTLDLNGGTTRTSQGTQLAGQGVLTGNGRLAGPLVVDYGARIEVAAGQRLQLTGGSVDHAGALRVNGTGATLEVGSGFTNRRLGEVRVNQGNATFAGAFTNEGRVIANGAELSFAGGLDNAAELNVSFGTSQIGGLLHNASSGRIVVSNGAQATFAGDLDNDGELRVSTGGAANFFGRVSGGGRITGGGQVRFEGGLGLAASRAATLTIAPESTLGADALTTLGLAGTAAGQHDHLAFTQAVTIEGGTLQLLWLGGASGQAGDRWDLFDWNGGVSGRYATLDLPALAAGLSWDTSALYGSGEVAITSVPEPATWALWLGALGAAALRRRQNRQPATAAPRRPCSLRPSTSATSPTPSSSHWRPSSC